MNKMPYKTYLSENDLPKAWYNVRADMKKKPAPLLDPTTLKPVEASSLERVFCKVRLVPKIVAPCFWLCSRIGLHSICVESLRSMFCAEIEVYSSIASSAPRATLISDAEKSLMQPCM